MTGHVMKITDKYIFFWNPESCLCQWHTSYFTDEDNVEYNCTGQYMMAHKAKLFKDNDMYQAIMRSTCPKEMQQLGHKVRNFDSKSWDKMKVDIAVHGSILKFMQNNWMMHNLLDTEDRVIVEASPHDIIWGVGLRETDPKILDPNKWQGQNLLGQTLMRTRSYIRAKLRNEIREPIIRQENMEQVIDRLNLMYGLDKNMTLNLLKHEVSMNSHIGMYLHDQGNISILDFINHLLTGDSNKKIRFNDKEFFILEQDKI